MALNETAVVVATLKIGAISGAVAGVVDIITGSDIASYIIGMAFAYLYAMNHKEFRVSLKEDISVVVIGMTLVYFISKLMPKLLGAFDKIEELGIINELSNIVGVLIGTIILLVVKYWLTIRDGVVRDKLDWATSNDRLKRKKQGYDEYRDTSYKDDYMKNERYNDD